MKKIFILMVALVLSVISCRAQIIPLEQHEEYKATGKEIQDGSYIKDVNNILTKFEGVWKGKYDNKNYEFVIVKNTRSFLGIKKDGLLMRYKITDNRGTVIENTLELPNDSPFVLKNGYVDKDKGYVFSYIGRDVACGQNGWVFTQVYGTGHSKLQLFLAVKGEKYPECTTGTAKQVFPVTSMELTKQK